MSSPLRDRSARWTRVVDAGSVEARQHAAPGTPRVGIAGRHAHGALELAQRVPPASLSRVDSPQVHVGELLRLVARRLLGLLEPGDCLVELALLHEVHADVVVRVTEVGIDGDRLEALGRCLLESPLKGIGPAEERVRLRGRTHGDRFLVEADRAVEIAFHLPPVRLAPQRDGALDLVRLAHDHSTRRVRATLAGRLLYGPAGARPCQVEPARRRPQDRPTPAAPPAQRPLNTGSRFSTKALAASR